MKLTRNGKNEISSKLKVFGEKSQALSSEFIKLLRLSVSQQNKDISAREIKVDLLTKKQSVILDEMNNGAHNIPELKENLKRQLKDIQSELDEVKKDQVQSRDDIELYNECLKVLGQYTNSFESDFISSLSIINNLEVDSDEK